MMWVLENILHYKKRQRIIALDLLRGFFLFIIIVNHIQRFPNGLDLLTGRGILWVSAAEGFVVISGILIGYIYGPRIQKDPKKIIKRLLKRALLIYSCVIGLALFFMGYSYAIAAIPHNSLDFVVKYGNNLPHLLFDTFTLQYVYGWAEFLSHYVIYLFAAPFILYMLVKKQWIYVLAGSIIIWALVFHPFVPRNRFDFTLSWQILFVGGTVFGYYLPEISDWMNRKFNKKHRVTIKKGLTVASISILFTSSYLTWGNDLLGKAIPAFSSTAASIQYQWNMFFTHSGFATLVDKTSLGPLRILFGIIVFWWLFIVFSNYSKKLPKFLFNFFNTLGEKSLFVYGLQSVVVFFIGLYVATSSSPKEFIVLNTGVTIGAVVFIYFITKNTAHFRELYERYLAKIKP